MECNGEHLVNDAARAWLQAILEDRFGYPFELRMVEGALEIHLAGVEGAVRFAAADPLFAKASPQLGCSFWDADAEGWQAPLRAPIPAPGLEELHSPLIRRDGNVHRVKYDILGMCFWCLARIEEIDSKELDFFGRFPATASHAFRYGYLDRPVVDEWLQILGQVLLRQWPGLTLKKHRFSVQVSHDVDRPSRYGFRSPLALGRVMLSDLLLRRWWKSVSLAPLIRLNSGERLQRADPYNTFDWIMDLSEEFGLKSAFYFICGRTDVAKDADYEPEHPAIRELMRRIHARGHEIGLHPSFNTFNTPGAIAEEASRLRQVCKEEGLEQAQWGARMHYLRWQQPVTAVALEEAGLAYDCSLGYADHAGFRCGTCFEYPAFDALASRILSVRLRPLIAMESTVISPQYMGLGSGEAAAKAMLSLRRTCSDMGGNFVFLWHNSELVDPEMRALYRRVISGSA